MGLTQFSFVFLPLCLVLAFQPDRLLQIVFVSANFTAAAAITFGSLGVQPDLVPTALFIATIVLQMLLGATHRSAGKVMRLLLPFLVVTAYALVSSWVMPRLFENTLLVYPQKVDVIGGTTLLAPNSGNFTQDCYLLAAAGFLVMASLTISRSRFNLQRLVDAFFVSGILAAVFCFWQFSHIVAGVPFPNDFLYSNPGWALMNTEVFGSVPRISGSFVEPADAASHLVGFVFAAAWVLFRGHRSKLAWCVLASTLLATLLTTSTTGFATLFLGAVLLGYYGFRSRNRGLASRTLLAFIVAIGLAGFAVLTIATLAPGVMSAASTVVEATLGKQDSSSYTDRTSTDLDSLDLGVATYGLGVGWGSNRSSSLIPGVVANLGIVGIAGLGVFSVEIWRRRRRVGRVAATPPERLALDAAGAGALGQLIAGCLSGPSLEQPDFYLLLALVVGVIVRLEHRATAQSKAAIDNMRASSPALLPH